MPITKRDIEKARDLFEEDAKDLFLGMSREDQLTILLSMDYSNSNRLAILERRQIDFESDMRAYRAKRERLENGDGGDELGTTQKIVKMIEEERAKQFNVWLWFRDRVMPTVITAITLAILALAFGAKLP